MKTLSKSCVWIIQVHMITTSNASSDTHTLLQRNSYIFILRMMSITVTMDENKMKKSVTLLQSFMIIELSANVQTTVKIHFLPRVFHRPLECKTKCSTCNVVTSEHQKMLLFSGKLFTKSNNN